MWVGDVVADRFEILRPIGSGGMGSIFCATDRLSGDAVAVKVLELASADALERFRREARVLSELSHPAIVRYVAHGETAAREPFLAMELLEGEDLAQRLVRGGISAEDSVRVGRQAAEALAFAHRKGIVHRDVKPSNLFLVGGDIGHLKVLDFGIARAKTFTQGHTHTGAMLGTVGYMAPEQAMGARHVDTRADVFALGCVLFECLTGRRAFAGDHAVAILAKVLAETPPRISELRPGLGEAVDVLVARMLSRDPDERPEDADAVLRSLDELGVFPGIEAATPSVSPAALTGSERRIVTVILAEPLGAETARTVTPDHAHQDIVRIRELAAKFGVEASPMAGGSLMLMLLGGGAATDQASRAASCALEVHRLNPDLRVVLATGWSETTGTAPVGPVIDRAAALLGASVTDATSAVGIDDVAAGLLGSRFEIRRHDGRAVLLREHESETPRVLLGKPTPCVGRAKDLAFLAATLGECVEERIARAILVTGPPGAGKSRLRQEFLMRVRDQGVARVVLAQADSMSAGSAFVLARQIVQRTSGLSPSDPWHVQHETLRTRLAPRIGPKESRLVADFVCELLGVPVQTDPSPPLMAARDDPRLLADWLRSSFEEWLRAEASEPLLIVLEDLHWGDVPTVTYLGRVLSEGNLPLMVLALARPEVRDVFPTLWTGTLQGVPLSGLGKRASEQLIRAVLNDIDTSTVTRIVERANGNAFYLEELIRAVAEGRGDSLPETVVAMAHARLERLETTERRVLRAASVLGERFWASGVAAILGAASDDVNVFLARLEAQEVVARSRREAFPAEREYTFRHALVRDAAYATLTEDDRKTAHRLAAAWLERVGENDPLVMADHLEKAGEPERAVPWIIRAAEAAYDGGSAVAAMRLAERGTPSARSEDLGMFRTIHGVSAGAQGELQMALSSLREAVNLLPTGSTHWFIAATNIAYYGAMAGTPSVIEELAQGIAEVSDVATRGGLYAWSAARVVLAYVYAGQPQSAKTFLDRLERAAAHADDVPSFAGWLAMARVYESVYALPGDLAAALRNARIAVAKFEEIRDPLAVTSATFWEAVGLWCVGRRDELVAAVKRGLARAEQSGNSFMARHIELIYWLSISRSERFAESVEPLTRLASDPLPAVAAASTSGLAYVLLARGDTEGAERVARESVNKSLGMRPSETFSRATLATVLLVEGRPEESLQLTDEALHFALGAQTMWDEVFLTRAQALATLGRTEEAHLAIRKARDRILRTASTLDEDDRASYLTNLEDVVRTLELAKEWLGDG